MFRFLIGLALVLVLGACASAPLQTDQIASFRKRLPATHKVEDVPFIRQEVAHCGPATLAMAMNWAGKAVTADEIAKQVYTPGSKGSFQSDMIGATRRNGFLAIPIKGFEPMLTEIAADHPVIIFENLGVSWFKQYHYAVVLGYDIDHQTLLTHTGPDAFKTQKMRRFEKDWMLGDYWGLVVLPPDQLSASADELTHVKSAFALEQLGNLDAAATSYRTILTRWPESLPAAVGAANVAFVKKDFLNSVRYLKQATEAHPQSAAAWHNLAIAQESAKLEDDAKRSALRAIDLANPEEKMVFVERLKDVIR